MGSLQSPPMEPPSPARLYATLAGAFLFVFGIAGFFEDRSWLNYLHVLSGAVGLLLAGAAARIYAILLGAIYVGLAIFAFGSDGPLHLTIGLLGLAAYAGTSHPKRGSKPTKKVDNEPRTGSESRAQSAGDGP
jgi:hypothetical protein